MNAKAFLAKPWTEISAAATELTASDLRKLMHAEHTGLRRAYVLRRLLGVLRKHQLQEDAAAIKQGELPKWV